MLIQIGCGSPAERGFGAEARVLWMTVSERSPINIGDTGDASAHAVPTP
jgi:hypothetical protein